MSMPSEDQTIVQEQHFETDEILQKRQNSLISRNTKVTVVLGVAALLAELIQIVVEILK